MKIFPLKYRPVITSLFLFSSMFIFANNVGAQEQSNKICKPLSELAHNIMASRQANAPMAGITEKAEKMDEPMREVLLDMIKIAYSSPRYSSEKNIQNAIKDFENAYYLKCLQDFEQNSK